MMWIKSRSPKEPPPTPPYMEGSEMPSIGCDSQSESVSTPLPLWEGFWGVGLLFPAMGVRFLMESQQS